MKYIKGFDGLRAISILFVLLTHLGLYYKLEGSLFLKNNFNLISGTTGVMIFFTISGFLITLLLLKEKNSKGKIEFKFFFSRRFLRLLPPLILFFAIIFYLMLFNYLPKNYIALLLSFFYLYNFVPLKFYVSELGHTWSLGVEEQFYLLWPFLLTFFKRTKKIIYITIGVIILSIVVKMIYRNPIVIFGNTYLLFKHFFPNRWFIPGCIPIMLGSLSAIGLFKYDKNLKKIFAGKIFIPILSAILFCIQLFVNETPLIVIELLQSISVCILLFWIYFNQESLLVRILEFKPISFIGKISYGLYVYQGLFLRTGPGGNLQIQKFPLNIVLVFAVAVLSYYFIEKPVLKYKNRFKPV